MLYIYFTSVVVSLIALILFIVISDRKVLFYNASFFIFVLLGNLAYYFMARVETVEAALVANKVTYFSGCALSLFLMMLVCDACKIELTKHTRMAMYGLNSAVMLLSMTVGYNDWFYKKCELRRINGVSILVKEYGPAHNLFLVMMYGYLLTGIVLLLVSLLRRKNLIYKNVIMMLFVYFCTVFCYTAGRKLLYPVDPICISYSIDTVILLFVTYNTGLYNLDEALLSSIEKQEHQGYVLFDKHYAYAGSNDVALKLIPELQGQRLTKTLNTSDSMVLERIVKLLEQYNGTDDTDYVSEDGRDLELTVQYLYKSEKVHGFILRVTDDSKQQGYIRQLDLISTNKSNFLSNVSHEIRTPINSVLGMNEMILRECEDPRIKEYALNIASAGQTLLQLINDVLDLSKIESGKLEVIPDEYMLADVIYDLENMIRPLIKTDKVTFRIELGENLPDKLFGDAIRVKQMVTNILTNACKYTEEGTICFRVDGIRNGDLCEMRFAVTDTGRGIKESDMGNLFDAFERVDQLKNSGIEGTGLGLAITKKFALMMDGDITVESTYGKGSTFTIIVPQKVIGDGIMHDYHTGRRNVERVEYTETFHASQAKILAVDDVKMNLTVIKLLLKETKMQITCCSSGQECIEAVQKEHYDLILLDHMMPDMDGIETLKRIREAHYCDDTPVIALTANADVRAKETYLECGFADYMSKPIEPMVLERMIAEYLPVDKIAH